MPNRNLVPSSRCCMRLALVWWPKHTPRSENKSLAMAQNAMMSAEHLWQSIRGEAETAVARDPMFGARLTHAILDHADLGSAVAHQIGERLGKSGAERAQIARVPSHG